MSHAHPPGGPRVPAPSTSYAAQLQAAQAAAAAAGLRQTTQLNGGNGANHDEQDDGENTEDDEPEPLQPELEEGEAPAEEAALQSGRPARKRARKVYRDEEEDPEDDDELGAAAASAPAPASKRKSQPAKAASGSGAAGGRKPRARKKPSADSASDFDEPGATGMYDDDPAAAAAAAPMPLASTAKSRSKSTKPKVRPSVLSGDVDGADKEDQKGLRHFSILVCQKLEVLKTSTYKEIADQLVQEANQETYSGYDEKNIRRRIYDALNVLMAMEIIGKERKQIRWKGFENCLGMGINDGTGGAAAAAAAAAAKSNGDGAASSIVSERDIMAVQRSIRDRRAAIDQKKKDLDSLALQYVACNSLIARNGRPGAHQACPDDEKIRLPFTLLEAEDTHPAEVMKDEENTTVLIEFGSSRPIFHNAQWIMQSIGEAYMARLAESSTNGGAASSAPSASHSPATMELEPLYSNGGSLEEEDSPQPPRATHSNVSATDTTDESFNALVSLATASAASPKLKPYSSRRSASAAAAAASGSAAASRASLAASSSAAAAAPAHPRSILDPAVFSLLPASSVLRAELPSPAAAAPPSVTSGRKNSRAAAPSRSASGVRASNSASKAAAAAAPASSPHYHASIPPSGAAALSSLGAAASVVHTAHPHTLGSVLLGYGSGLGRTTLPSPAGLAATSLSSPVKLELSSGGATSMSMPPPLGATMALTGAAGRASSAGGHTQQGQMHSRGVSNTSTPSAWESVTPPPIAAAATTSDGSAKMES